MSQRKGMGEYVMNPSTNRMMRKDGRAYKRWRKNNPLAPEPPTFRFFPKPAVCTMHPKSSPPPPPPSRAVRGSSAPTRMTTFQEPTFLPQVRIPPTPPPSPRRTPTTEELIPPPPPPAYPEPLAQESYPEVQDVSFPLSPPPLRRCNAWTDHMFQAQRDAMPDFNPDERAEVEDDQDKAHTVRDLLQRHGASLLRAYNDPKVDFMQVVARHLEHM